MESPFLVSVNTTVKAVVYATGVAASQVASASYLIQAGAPSFSPAAGTFSSAQTVSLSSATVATAFRYTVDGSAPSAMIGTGPDFHCCHLYNPSPRLCRRNDRQCDQQRHLYDPPAKHHELEPFDGRRRHGHYD